MNKIETRNLYELLNHHFMNRILQSEYIKIQTMFLLNNITSIRNKQPESANTNNEVSCSFIANACSAIQT